MHCQKCWKNKPLTWWKREWVCEECMNPTAPPRQVEEFIKPSSSGLNDDNLPG